MKNDKFDNKRLGWGKEKDKIRREQGLYAWLLQRDLWNELIDQTYDSMSILDHVASDDPTPEELLMAKELFIGIVDVLETIPPSLAMTIIQRFGLDEGDERTLEEVGIIQNVTRERIRQKEKLALNRLRYPSRKRYLQTFIYRELLTVSSADKKILDKKYTDKKDKQWLKDQRKLMKEIHVDVNMVRLGLYLKHCTKIDLSPSPIIKKMISEGDPSISHLVNQLEQLEIYTPTAPLPRLPNGPRDTVVPKKFKGFKNSWKLKK